MALITDLPAATSLASTDLLVIDTGSATKKITASNAGASASNAGLVTTGAQTFAGQKTHTSALKVNVSSTDGTMLQETYSNASNGLASTILAVSGSDYSSRMYFRTYSGNSSGLLSNFEQYRLPQTDSGRTTNGTYEILTTKTDAIRGWCFSAGDTASVVVSRDNVAPSSGRPTSIIVMTYEGLTLLKVTGSGSSLSLTLGASLGTQGVSYDSSTKTISALSTNRELVIIADRSFTFTAS